MKKKSPYTQKQIIAMSEFAFRTLQKEGAIHPTVKTLKARRERLEKLFSARSKKINFRNMTNKEKRAFSKPMRYKIIIRHKKRIAFEQVGYPTLKDALEAAAFICSQDEQSNHRSNFQISVSPI